MAGDEIYLLILIEKRKLIYLIHGDGEIDAL